MPKKVVTVDPQRSVVVDQPDRVENLPAREWVQGVYGGVVSRPPKINKRFRPLHPLERRVREDRS
jgi:hypothetical protein